MSDLAIDAMAEAFENRFGVEIETVWNILSMSHVTARMDDEPLTDEQVIWLDGWEAARMQP